MTNKEFVKTINSLRLANKNKWYYWQGEVNNKQVSIKGFGTWLQVFNVDNINHSNAMDQSITEFKKHLENSVK